MTQDFWEQFEVAEYDKPQYDETYWGQFETTTQNKEALNNSLTELPDNDPYVQTQKHQTEQLANMLFTKEELDNIEKQGEIGWVEYRNRGFVGWSDILPLVGTAKQAYQAGKTLAIAKKLEKGEEISDADKSYMRDYLRNYVELSKRGMSWSAKGASMFVQAPSFMIEFALSGGIGEAAVKGVITATTKSASKVALKGATKTAARVAGQQAILVPAYAVANYNERKIADGLNITDKGDAIFNSQEAENNNVKNAFKGLGTGEIQILSELSGGLIGKVAGGAFGLGEKALGKVATTNVARGISATSAKIYNSLPKNVRVKLEAAARVADTVAHKATQAGQKMKEKGGVVGFHGVAEEMGEERVGDILMTAFDLDSKEGYSGDQWLSAIFPEPQQLLLEAGIFSIVGASSLATRTVIEDLTNKGYSEKEATVISQNLSEIEKENLANDILGEVKINEDITEEEVAQEADAIQLKLFGGVEMNVNEKGEEVAADAMYDMADTAGAKKNYNSYNDFVKEFSENAENEPQEYTINNAQEAIKDLGITPENPKIIQTPIEKLQLRADRLEHIINGGGDGHPPDKTRYKSLNKMFATLERPDIVIQRENAAKDYIKVFKSDDGKRNQIVFINSDENGDFISTTMPVNKNKKYILDKLNGGEIIYKKEQTGVQKNSAVNNIINDNVRNFNPQIKNKAEVIEDELEAPITLADKIIQGASKFGKFYTEWVDRYTPIENLVKKAEEKTGEKLDISSNPYYQARMYAGLVESIKQQVNDKTFVKENGKIKITGEGFLPIINDYVEEVKDIEPNYDTAIEDLSDYLIANRYLLDLKDREGYEATEEQKLKAVEDMAKLNLKYGNKIDDISKIADRIYAFNQRILHNLVDSGNMSQETYDKIIADNPHHISYKRVMDDNNWGTAFVPKGKFTDAKSPVKKIKGSERDIQNIFVSTLEDVSRILDVVERNKVARSVADLKNILPEYIQDKKPAMEKRTAMVKVTYDAKMRKQLEEAIKYFGRTFENVKSIKTPTGYALGAYSEQEKLVRKKLGSQDRTLAHEVGHMLDYALDVENKIKKNSAIMKEITQLAEDRFSSTVKLEDGEYVTEEAKNTEKYKNYVRSNKEMIANMFDLYFTSRDYVKRVAPETAKFIDNLFKGEYKFLNDIRPSSETATEEIEQDVWTPSRNKPFGNVIEYFENGKPKFIEVTKPVMDAVEGMNSQEIDFVNKFLTGSATMLRTGATLTPEFAIRNFIRDQESATIYIKNYNPFIDGVRGLMNVLGKNITGKNQTYDEWVKAGGAFGSYMELNEKSVNKALREFVGEGSKMRNIFSYANPIKLAEEFSSIFEQATRLGMYTRSKMNGADAMQAALDAREGTLDFARSGSLGRKYNRILPFFNAGIQGVDKMVRTFRDHPYLSSIKAIGTMTIPQLALTGYYLYFAPDDDREEYLNIPQYQKDFFYCFKIGNNWIRIPKDFTLGYLFGSVPERFITWAYQNKKPEGKDLAQMAITLFGSVSPVNNPTDVLPPILRILIENTANYSFFRGQHIYPGYMNNLEPSLRANKFNSETSKWLGEKLNMSPAKIDHTISSLLGTSGKYLTDAGDLMINSVREFNNEKTPVRVKTLADAPFLRGFVLRDPVGYQAVSTNEFFENYKAVSEKHASYNKLVKSGDREAARQYKEKYGLELRAYKRLNNTKKQISDIGKQMDKIYADKKLTNKEKQERLQSLAKRISDMAFDSNVWYGEFIKE